MSLSVARLAAEVRQRNPLVHNITNYVAAPLQANALSAIGASPIMADDAEEVAEMVSLSDGLVINLGTLNRRTIDSMHTAMRTARTKGIPIVFDPVGAGATELRRQTAHELLAQHPVSIIRANAGEIAFLAENAYFGKGVDAGIAPEKPLDIARKVARRHGCIVAMTGETDYITDGIRTYVCHNGDAMMSVLVGTGCTATSVVAAFAATHPHNLLAAATAALCYYGLCGEIAAEEAVGPGSLAAALLDNLYRLPEEVIEQSGRLSVI
ncbi:MAG: hydroxyethylthiazole kinase [Neisseria sp.]|nr:hydroxyethylthiazole kinase [Neisseria sp.]